MKILIHDDLIRVKNIKGGKANVILPNTSPIDVKKDDTILISHSIDVSHWSLFRFLFFGAKLIINEPEGGEKIWQERK